MPRIPLFPLSEPMTPEQRRVYEAIVSGPRGTIVGPLRAALHSPELADRWQHLGAFLRYKTTLPNRLGELAILVTARRWNSQVEWYVHAQAASKAGISDEVIEAIRVAESPVFSDPDEAAVYEFSRELQVFGQVSEKIYRQIQKRFDTVGVVELTALIGYYTMVSMTLNVHDIPLPEGVVPPLEPISDNTIKPSKESGRTSLHTLSPAVFA
ncbi:carboxymuconolactone decarboxylase family protein [Thermodesulfobacteriota bacterium]